MLDNEGVSTHGQVAQAQGKCIYFLVLPFNVSVSYEVRGFDNSKVARSLKIIVFCILVKFQLGNYVQCIIRSLKVLVSEL